MFGLLALECMVIVALFVAIGLARRAYALPRAAKESVFWALGLFLWGGLIATFGAAYLTDVGEYLAASYIPETQKSLFAAAVLAPLTEETTKGLAVLLALEWNRREVPGLLDGMLYGALVGLGFEATENILYILSFYLEYGFWGVTLYGSARVFAFGFTHALFTSLTGLGVALARLLWPSPWSVLALPLGWLAAVILHMTHNVLVSASNLLCWGALFFDVAGLYLVWKLARLLSQQERAWVRRYLWEEFEQGLITWKQYQTACTQERRRTASRLARNPQQAKRIEAFYRALVQLAVEKAKADMVWIPGQRRRIQALRQRIRRWAPHMPDAS